MMQSRGKKTKRNLSRARFQIIPVAGQPSRRRDWIGSAKFRHLILLPSIRSLLPDRGAEDVKNTVPFLRPVPVKGLFLHCQCEIL
jgi:hypothetical protein